MSRADLMAKRIKFEENHDTEEVQRVYDECREARLHVWDRNDPSGGGRLHVHERKDGKPKGQIILVRRELMCLVCTTIRIGIYWYVSSGIAERWQREGNYQYKHPQGYTLRGEDGRAAMGLLEIRAAAFDRLPVIG